MPRDRTNTSRQPVTGSAVRTVSLLAASFLALSATSPAAEAQSGVATGEQGADRGFALEEIVVTARRREEGLQTTPIAITAITGAALEERGVEDLTGLANLAPNVNFSFGGTSSGSGSAAVVYIRGVGQNDFTPVTDPGVGIYVDDVYLGRTIGSVLDIFALERAEILRGPQGTLFGRNTIGGAISLSSHAPGEEFGGDLRVIAGEDNRYEAFVTLDVPLADNLRSSFSGLYRSRDGYVDRMDGVTLGDDDVLGGRLKLVLDASDSLSFTLAVDGVREREQSAPEVFIDILESATFMHLYNDNVFGNGAPSSCFGGGPSTDPNCANDQYIGAPFTSFETGPSVNDIDNWGISLVADWQITDNVALKSISAYRDVDARFARASDGTPFKIFQTTDDYVQDQFSQEFRLIGDSFDNRLHWVGGMFYFEEQATNIGLIEGIIPNFPRHIGGDTDNDSFAVFGEVVFDVTDRMHLTGGLRYTDETKRFTPLSISLVSGQVFVPQVENKLTTDELTWRGSLSYDMGDQALGYLTVSRGFKSGGFVLRLSDPAPFAPAYEPEFVTQYEVGLKTEFPSIGLRINTAAFFSDYTDIQVAANPPGAFATVTANAAKAEIKGLEVEFTYVPVGELFIDGSVGYQDAAYKRIDVESNVEVSLADDLIRTPEWSANIGASYLFGLGNNGSLTPRVDIVGRSRIEFEPVNNPKVSEGGYTALDVSLTYENPDQTWRARLGVNNATDERYLVAADSNDTIGYVMGVYARPQNWYLSVDYSF